MPKNLKNWIHDDKQCVKTKVTFLKTIFKINKNGRSWSSNWSSTRRKPSSWSTHQRPWSTVPYAVLQVKRCLRSRLIYFTKNLKWQFHGKIRETLFTLFEIFIFHFWFSEKIVDFFGWKNSWKCCGFGLFSCWQLLFHEKNCQKNLCEKLVKMFGFCKNWIFRQKFWLFENFGKL